MGTSLKNNNKKQTTIHFCFLFLYFLPRNCLTSMMQSNIVNILSISDILVTLEDSKDSMSWMYLLVLIDQALALCGSCPSRIL